MHPLPTGPGPALPERFLADRAKGLNPDGQLVSEHGCTLSRRGGDGTVRRIRFLEKMELTVLSHHHIIAPYGLVGGESGRCGRNWVERASGAVHEMVGQDHCPVGPGDVFVLETPSGGEYGAPPESCA